MGQLEKEAKQVRRRGEIRDALLLTLLIGGMIALGAAPRALMPRLSLKPRDARQYKNHVRTAASRLVQKGLAEWVEQEGKVYLRITPAGKHSLRLMTEGLKLKNKPRRWDKRWRIVIFDVPERRRPVRYRLRRVMTEVGFVRVQNSVWAFPYDCEEFVALLKTELRIGKDVLYAIVERLENDKQFRAHFKLPD